MSTREQFISSIGTPLDNSRVEGRPFRGQVGKKRGKAAQLGRFQFCGVRGSTQSFSAVPGKGKTAAPRMGRRRFVVDMGFSSGDQRLAGGPLWHEPHDVALALELPQTALAVAKL